MFVNDASGKAGKCRVARDSKRNGFSLSCRFVLSGSVIIPLSLGFEKEN